MDLVMIGFLCCKGTLHETFCDFEQMEIKGLYCLTIPIYQLDFYFHADSLTKPLLANLDVILSGSGHPTSTAEGN